MLIQEIIYDVLEKPNTTTALCTKCKGQLLIKEYLKA